MENLRFECTLLSSVRVSLSREERLPVTRNNRLPISFALSFTKRIRRIPYLSIFELFLRGNPFESRPFLSEKKKEKKKQSRYYRYRARWYATRSLKKRARAVCRFFHPSCAPPRKSIDPPSLLVDWSEIFFFFLFFTWSMEN